MANTYKVLGQVLPATANAETTLYTVPASTSTIVATITVCNITSASATYRVNVRPAGAAVAAVHALARDVTIQANGVTTLTLGLTLGTTDVISVQSSSAGAVAFHCYGTEIA